jgi:hypothetical protein
VLIAIKTEHSIQEKQWQNIKEITHTSHEKEK